MRLSHTYHFHIAIHHGFHFNTVTNIIGLVGRQQTLRKGEGGSLLCSPHFVTMKSGNRLVTATLFWSLFLVTWRGQAFVVPRQSSLRAMSLLRHDETSKIARTTNLNSVESLYRAPPQQQLFGRKRTGCGASYWRKLVWNRLCLSLLTAIGAILLVTPTMALALPSTTTITPTVPSLSSSWKLVRRNWKIIRNVALLLITTKLTYDWRCVKRRQAADATSEWGRYSKNPGARGRALMALLFGKVLPLFILTKVPLLLGAQRRDRLLELSGKVLTDGLLQVGPLYVKIGQIISSRDDIVPAQWVKQLERLQDQVPAKSGQAAYDLAYKAWPVGRQSFQDTFRSFDPTPLAAASLGQVHLGTLRSSNDTVAIKLQRPYLREIYDQDFVLLTNIAAAVDRFGGTASQVGGVQQSWKEIFEDAEEILYREIDYRDEADNGVRFCRDFGLAAGGKAAKGGSAAVARNNDTLPSAASWIRAPIVYDELSSEKVLVMEFVPSIKVTKLDKLKQAGLNMRDREYLADCLGRAYLRQFCCNLFFSTDPHAGNLGVEVLDMNATVPEKRVRLVFYDFGQAAELNRNQADGILDVIEAIVDSDVEKSVKSFEKMGVLKEDADLDKVRAKVSDNFKTGKVKANRKRLSQRGYKFAPPQEVPSNKTNSTATTAATSRDKPPQDSEVMQFFSLPAEYAFVARALSQMDGVGKVLDPEFDFISAAAPWIVEIKGATQYLRDEAIKWLNQARYKLMPHYVEGKDPFREKEKKLPVEGE